MDLLAVVPRGDLTSTEYALANVGEEYLVHQPADSSASFTVTLVAGTEVVQHRDPYMDSPAEITVIDTQAVSFTPPFASPSPSMVHLGKA
jgi:hypothetical protein